MPVTTTYTCEVCHKTLADADLAADETLRRIIISGVSVSKSDGTATDTASTAGLVFCGLADAEAWCSGQTQDIYDAVAAR